MDSFDFDSVKAEKANAMLKYRRLRNVTKLFRFAELFLVLILFFWIFTHLPFAIQISGEYFRKISTVIASHLFRTLCVLHVKSGSNSHGLKKGFVRESLSSESVGEVESRPFGEISQNTAAIGYREMPTNCNLRGRSGETWYPEDELSNEDFQRTIEAFIARELRFRRQESLAIVLQDQN
ncbi:hypothetical protein CK203_006232 [Vitis vinifera]|uniref:Uncharacterized protein n=1 Tax=Vitis vinifera TaxID=29760 RepID=A0A438K5N2_VITVI|nr:hypothetical protein CK203_006232 [Vitis vinifera]